MTRSFKGSSFRVEPLDSDAASGSLLLNPNAKPASFVSVWENHMWDGARMVKMREGSSVRGTVSGEGKE
ncbi:hypothetical protein RRG08_035836 [Elysia crispata]|uniref:Uncharacterized protein n=1 Tax=Elysia crispata TaxID=231223 RepID=A0AAE1DA65_9GAST|nr:hypothetical protein RRG08_035836 [Elysia crispata]